jgi:hypothetical protein
VRQRLSELQNETVKDHRITVETRQKRLRRLTQMEKEPALTERPAQPFRSRGQVAQQFDCRF